MTNNPHRENVRLRDRFRAAFKPRDLFLHDGRSLKRFTIGSRVQMAATGAVAAMVAWSGFTTVQFAVSMTGDVATMQAQVAEMQSRVDEMRDAADERAALLEQRQAVLQAMLSGDASLNEVAGMLPASADQPESAAEHEINDSYSEVDAMQMALAQQAHQANRARIAQTAGVMRSLGLDPNRFVADGVGGPFEEVRTADVDPRFMELFSAWAQAERLERGVAAIPSRMPVDGFRFTSGYGTRSDPFRGRAAMHAGIDMAGPVGTPIYATADAVVGHAGVRGGYGNLVELQHGSGIATRYAHLSRILVAAGERVRRGQLIGLMGSTGRSTGSHLHYEVRIDGRAVNPLPFLQSAEALAAVQSTPVAGARSGR